MEPSRGRKHSLWVTTWVLGLGLGLALLGMPARIASAAPQEKEQEEEAKVVKPPKLSRAAVRSPEAVCLRPSTVICEDFEKPDRSKWGDYKNALFDIKSDAAFGGKRSLRQRYKEGQSGAGWLGWHFGDHPEGGVRRHEKFEEIYFRFYHKFQKSWPDRFPPRFARVRSRYAEGDLLFAWEEALMISARLPNGTALSVPMSGLAEPAGTTHLGDVRWLEREAADVRFAERRGDWVAIEMRVKLNTPGQSDGRITYWMNDERVLDREGVNLRGAYTATTINVARLEGYWNDGAPRSDLKRWYDNVVVATEPVGCAVFSVQKKKLKEQSAWQLQVATAADEAALVWDSGKVPGEGVEIDISDEAGSFAEGADRCLLPSAGYVMRARHAAGDTWSEWSEWEPMFK